MFIEILIIFVQEEHYIALFDSVLLIRFENGYNKENKTTTGRIRY